MSRPADEVIEGLKKAFGADTDAELGEALGIARSSVASWRARGSVPQRYIRKLADGARTNIEGATTEMEMAAQRLGKLRWLRDFQYLLDDYKTCLTEAGRADAKLDAYIFEAFDALTKELETNRSMSLFEVYSSLVHRDLFERQSERDDDVPNRRALKP